LAIRELRDYAAFLSNADETRVRGIAIRHQVALYALLIMVTGTLLMGFFAKGKPVLVVAANRC
jgi:hypothetical protein